MINKKWLIPFLFACFLLMGCVLQEAPSSELSHKEKCASYFTSAKSLEKDEDDGFHKDYITLQGIYWSRSIETCVAIYTNIMWTGNHQQASVEYYDIFTITKLISFYDVLPDYRESILEYEKKLDLVK